MYDVKRKFSKHAITNNFTAENPGNPRKMPIIRHNVTMVLEGKCTELYHDWTGLGQLSALPDFVTY